MGLLAGLLVFAVAVPAVFATVLAVTGMMFIGPPSSFEAVVLHACTFSRARNPGLTSSSAGLSCLLWIENGGDGKECCWLGERVCECAPPENPAVVPALVSRKRMLSNRRSCWRKVVCRSENSGARSVRKSPLSL